MILLAVETSSIRGSLALHAETGPIREAVFDEGLVHGREVTSRLEDLLRLEGLEPRAIGAIAVGIGPGSYTGLRVGVTAAKSIAFALRIPLVAESSLLVIASGAARTIADLARPGILVPLLDARQGLFFHGIFGASGGRVERLSPDRAAAPAEILEAISASGAREAVAIGEGADAFLPLAGVDEVGPPRTKLRRAARENDVPRASVLAGIAWERASTARFDAEAIHSLEPAYLRVTEAERKLSLGRGTP
jgi:tRNA threonylcarbamoyladenosine biosynthesis protein TsaB